MEFPYGVYRCAGGLGSKFLFNAYKAVLEGSAIPDCFAESRTVFIPETSDIDDLRAIVIANSLLLLFVEAFIGTLCDAFTPHRDASHLGKMPDNIFEIETSALAHVACAPHESGVFSTTSPLHIPLSIIPGSSLRLRTLGRLAFSVASCEVLIRTASHTLNLREQNGDNSLWPEEYDKVVLRVVSFLQWPLTRSSDGSKKL